MKSYLALLTLAVLSAPVYAQNIAINEETCEPLKSSIISQGQSHRIYPSVAVPTNVIKCRIKRLTENANYVADLREINRMGLTRANTKVQPWGGSFWPLNQGQIANPYQDKNYGFLNGALNGLQMVSWKVNYSKFQKRKQKVHAKIYEISEKDLAELAPSEKYDILLGDTNFDLTNRIWQYASTWGEQKKYGFLSSIAMPSGYKLPDTNSLMALWEGICHGWAVAAGHADRPENTVWVTLPNNKRMPFYPNDLKALTSLMWANSVVQDAVIVEGLRCNDKHPEKDEFGRFIDTKFDKNDTTLLPRCADVHPAVYHTSIVNILGIEGRSFVVDKSAKASIANQPVAGYEYSYYNPETEKDGTLEASALSIYNYTKDPFRAARNEDTRFIVGVAMKLKYVDWENPVKHETNSPADDKISEIKFNYDLELDANFRIVGGQWRVDRDGSSRLFDNKTHQPDFFWVVPREYKKYFAPVPGLPQWDFSRSTLPPKEFLPVAKNAHAFVYNMTKEFGWNEKCDVKPIKGNGPMLKVDCEFKYGRPQPLVNVVDKLVEESRR